jgi:hypothetical protein
MSQSVSDFIEIVGDSQITIGDGNTLWEAQFSTKGRSSSSAFLMFNIRGLTYSTFDVDVKINNSSVGQIYHYGGVNDADRDQQGKHWYTQMIAVSGSTLTDGVNEIQIQAVKNPSPTASDTYDNFNLKNVVCFFHKSV